MPFTRLRSRSRYAVAVCGCGKGDSFYAVADKIYRYINGALDSNDLLPVFPRMASSKLLLFHHIQNQDEILSIILASYKYVKNERKRKRKQRWWVHSLNLNRYMHGAYHTLVNELISDEQRFKGYLYSGSLALYSASFCFTSSINFSVSSIENVAFPRGIVLTTCNPGKPPM